MDPPDGANLSPGERLEPSELKSLLGLAVPIVTVQVGLMLMGVVDTMMVGRVSSVDLAAVALGNLYVFGALVTGMGALMALDPVVSQAVGASDRDAVARGVQRGLILAAVLTLPASLALLPAGSVLAWLRQPSDVVPIAADYVRVNIPAAFPFFAFVVLRQSLQAMRRVAPIVVTIVIANVINVGLNWVLIFGRLGFPAMGAVGSGWATTISRWLMAALLLGVSWKLLRPFLLPPRRDAARWRPLARMVGLGAPIGFQYLLEFGAFAVISLFMGWLGTREIASHQIALNLASLTFMVPLGVSAAVSVRVGQAVGRAEPAEAVRSSRIALRCGAAFMGACGLLFLAAPGLLSRLYTNQADVAALAAVLIPIAGFFQIFDGLQVVAVGILRGLGETRTPLIVNVLGFWLVGMPLSIFLGFGSGAGAVGLWWGLVGGLSAVAVILLLRVRYRMSREMPRLVIDEGP